MVDRFNSTKVGQNSLVRFIDLDGDGYDEKVIHFSTAIGQCAMKITTREDALLGQWNFDGELPAYNHPLTSFDIDHDGLNELFVLFQRHDSVFFGGVDHRIDSALLLTEYFVDRIRRVKGKIHYHSQLYHHDLNNDGTEELVICLNAGYSEKPRKIYAYDFVNDTLFSSIQTGYFNIDLQFFDVDDDGKIEILASTNSNENIETGLGIDYSDYYRWFALYDHELNPEFEPVRMGKGKGAVYSYLFKNNEGNQILVVDMNKKSQIKTRFYHLDLAGKKFNRINPGVDSAVVLQVFQEKAGDEEKIMIFSRNKGLIYNLNKQTLTCEVLTKLGGTIENVFIMDVDNDDVVDAITINRNIKGSKTICIYTHNFSQSHEFTLPIEFENIRPALRYISPEKSHLVFQANERLFEYELRHDPDYWIKSLSMNLGIFLFYVLLIWPIMKIQKNMLKKRYKREKSIAELKLKSIRNQMDPHFTFNAVNAIASAIYKEDRQTAYSYFSKFSKLMRSTMLYSDRMSRFLDDEIDFTIKYLEIEKFRFREKFEYHLNIDDSVNLRREVPRMIVQAFAGSAIANGLMHRRQGGLLDIDLREVQNHLIITFTDNGVGIGKSREYNKEKAFKSIRIIDEFIAVFNEFNEKQITYQMFDTKEDGEITGTKVIVKVPLGMNYSFGDDQV
ncbi:MAG: sensor histidine kinase [Bacteroidales bacterium]